MHTSHTKTDAITFLHDGTPDGGDLRIVLNVDEANNYNAEHKMFTHARNQIKFEATDRTEFHGPTVEIILPYDIVRDFILGKLRDRQVAELEDLEGTDLVNHFTQV